jgi:DNA repair protein SbcD/Mre11
MKKVLGILVNDVHLDKDNGELVKDIFHQLISLCEQCKTNRIFCGGDVFTNRSGQPLSCLTDWKEILSNITDAGLELHVIPGNHDKTDPNDERSYLDVYSDKCVHLYRTSAVTLIDGAVFVFMPYFKEDKWLEEYEGVSEHIAEMYFDHHIDKGVKKFLITHMAIEGVKNNDGSVVHSNLTSRLFSDYDKVLVGHYHNASKIGENIFYTGSAYQNNYGEDITDKGFTIIYDDGSIKSVPSKFPKYIKRVIDAGDKETLRNLLEQYDGEQYDHIRLVFVGKKEDCQNINVTEIESRYGIDCKFQTAEEIEAMQACEEDSVTCYDSKTILKEFYKFCSENDIRGDKMKYGVELLKEKL